jgi:hypothetical protein
MSDKVFVLIMIAALMAFLSGAMTYTESQKTMRTQMILEKWDGTSPIAFTD